MSPSPSTQVTAESPESPPTPSPVPSQVKAAASRLFAPMPSSSSPTPESGDPSLSQSPGEEPPTWSTHGPSDLSSDLGEPSDTPSTGKGLKLSKAGLRAGVGATFRQVCKLAGSVLATQYERELGVWVPDSEDVDDVARPATSIIYRRIPDDAKGGDVIDLIALGLALLAYVGKSTSKRAEVRAYAEFQATQGIDVTGGETPA